jgi:EAL domain-containing protein (putative c-di-GMP-specific phosphodiesterase class I)
VKLDFSLTRGIDRDRKRRALASALIAFARETDVGIIAEGVETSAELLMLQSLGVKRAQGYYLARPKPLAELPGAITPAPSMAVPPPQLKHMF